MDIKTSIIVPAYNDSIRLQNLFTSFDSLEYEEPFEVIVVDDASSDDTPAVCQEWAKSGISTIFVILAYPKIVDRALLVIRVRMAYGDIVTFTDSDCRVHPLWLKKITSALNQKKKLLALEEG